MSVQHSSFLHFSLLHPTDVNLGATVTKNPISVQEDMYRLPYHWFPEERLKGYERREKRRIIQELITKYNSCPIREYLDVGCGDGRWTSDISRHLQYSSKCIGVDFSERAIGFARLISPQIDFRIQAGENLDFGDESFDLVTAIEVIEHVPDKDELNFLEELRRVLRRRGLLVITTPSTNLRLAAHHYRHYTLGRLCSLFKEARFSVLEVRGQSTSCYGVRRWLRKRMNLFPALWKLWRFTYREVHPQRALNLMLAVRPAVD